MRDRRAELAVERIFELSPDLLCIESGGRFTRVNPSFERTLGYSSAELLSRPLLEFVHLDDRKRTATELGAVREGKTVRSFRNRYLCRDGSTRWIEWTARLDPDQGFSYAMGRDVTERHRAENEQAALRRLATLVAGGIPPAEVFDAVAGEVGRLLDAGAVGLLRYEDAETATLVASYTDADMQVPALGTFPLDGQSVTAKVCHTGRPARMDADDWEDVSGSIAAEVRRLGQRSSVGAPIVADGRLWGAIVASWSGASPPADTEDRLAAFTELVATAIANAENRAELNASRARVVAAADESRRQIERDLHDGTQQRLVSLVLALRATQAKLSPAQGEVKAELEQTARDLADAVEDLREISRGIHPAILSEGGLEPALKTLARRSAVPVQLRLNANARLPESVEVAAYYVVSEALANAAKHAQATLVRVDLDAVDGAVELRVRDDGVGGADPRQGSGLIGLRDRVEAIGGALEITSSASAGTSLRARLPVAGPEDRARGADRN